MVCSRAGVSALDKFVPVSNPGEKYERATFFEGMLGSLLKVAY